MTHLGKQFRANIAAGLFLLLPVTIGIYILGRLWRMIHGPVSALAERWGVEGVLKVNGIFVLSTLVLVLFVVLLGMIVRMRGKGRVQHWVEQKLLDRVPGYSYIRILLEARLGLAEPPEVRPALLRTGDGWQPVFHVDTVPDGRHIVYLPDVPVGATGSVLVVEAANLQLLEGSVLSMDKALRRYGKGLGDLLGS